MAESKDSVIEKNTTVFNIKFDPSDENEIQLVQNDEMEIDETVKEVLEHVCGKCKRVYASFYSLRKHMENCKNNVEDRLIDEDYEELSMTEILKLQKSAKNMSKSNICFCCEESLETAHTGHIRCQECPKSFKTAVSFQRHMSLLHSSSAKYPCQVCNAKCPTNLILEIHLLAHENGKPFACQKCGKDFTRRYHLQRHQEHSNCDPTKQKPEMKCKVCGKGFSRVDNLRNHLRAHIGENTKQRDYQCPYCDKSFFGTTTMNIHIRTHTGERPFICDLCKRGFASNGALRKHRRSHTGEKPFQCTVCERAFAAKEVLNRHMKTHTGERPHVCDNCGKKFIQATQLKAHMFHHTGEHGFPCEKCNIEFNRKIRLTEHENDFHSKDKRILDCKSCKAKFDSKTELIEHMNLHETTKGYKCRACRKKFLSLELHSFCALCQVCSENTGENVEMHQHGPIIKSTMAKRSPKIVCTEDERNSTSTSERRKIKILTSKAKSSTIISEMTDVENYSNEDVLKSDITVENTIKIIDTHLDSNDSNAKLYIDKIDENVKHEISEESQQCNIFLDDKTLKTCVSKLLNLLLDKELLTGFGWPTASVEHVLSAVIKQCGHEPADYDSCSDYTTKIRENVKLLFTVVIDNDSFKRLLNNHTIDEVILQILQMTN